MLIVGQHGTPLQIIDLGETSIDEGTFDEYIDELRESYVAEKVCRGAIDMHKSPF